jgi:hypothetical protein
VAIAFWWGTIAADATGFANAGKMHANCIENPLYPPGVPDEALP